jgi:hypothetical protein
LFGRQEAKEQWHPGGHFFPPQHHPPHVDPVPDKLTVCGLAPPLSLMDTPPVTAPVRVGLKVTVIVQDLPAPTLLPQVFVWENSLEPVTVMLVMLSVVLPTFVRVVVNALLLPTVTVPKFKLVGLSSTTVPVPVRVTF